jgi:glycosyltransferase involved in cell wall biosynthesis
MREKRLKISVCIVTYNHGLYIDDCLASVVGQQVDADLEILVGDDCSTDSTRQIISAYMARYPALISAVFHPENIGGTPNYQTLINRASGEYIARLDGDDFWLPGKLSKQLEFLEKNPDCAAAYSNAMVINNSGMLEARFNGAIPETFDLDYLMSGGNFLNASSMIFRARCKYPILQLRGAALDYQFSILLAKQGLLGYVNCILVAYRINSTASIIVNNHDSVLDAYWRAILCAVEMGAGKRALQKCICKFNENLFRSAILRGQSRKAWSLYTQMTKDCSLVTTRLLIRSALTLPFYVGKALIRKLARRIRKGGCDILVDR